VTVAALNPFPAVTELVRHRVLLAQLIRRDVLLRYRGTMFGAAWMFLSPLLMLAIFAFVFGAIFQSRWPQQDDGIPLWVILFAGLIVFNVFSETVSAAPSTVRAYPSFVKRIIFPVEILPVVPLGTALVHATFNFAVLSATLAWFGHLQPGILLVPMLMIPLALLALGVAWFLAAWGVFIKDTAQVVPPLVQMLLFLSPVLYPLEAVPDGLRPVYERNPLGAIIEACRAASFGRDVGWSTWAAALLFGLIAAALGLAFFRHAREEFADVL
jgi:lipopolysaccharide transport system permease protein